MRSISFSRSSTVGGNGVCIAYGDPTDALDGTPELTIEWDDDRRAYVSQWLDAASLFDPDERDFVVLPDGAITEDGLIVTIEHSEMDDLGTARVLDNNMTNVIELDAHARGGEIRFVFEDIGIDDHLDCVEFGFAHG